METSVRREESEGVTQFIAYDPVADRMATLSATALPKTVRWRNIARSLLIWFIVIALSGGIGVCFSASIIVRRFMVMPIKSIRNYLRRFSESFTAEEPPESLRHDEIGDLAIYIHLLTEKIERQTRELDRLASTDG
jgi:methyl-accepting chemotaxis protein